MTKPSKQVKRSAPAAKQEPGMDGVMAIEIILDAMDQAAMKGAFAGRTDAQQIEIRRAQGVLARMRSHAIQLKEAQKQQAVPAEKPPAAPCKDCGKRKSKAKGKS